MAFFDRPISEVVKCIQNGEDSCHNVAARAVTLIEEQDKEFNSFISVNKEAALKAAADLDKLQASLKKEMPLYGVPVAVKDNICVSEGATTCASKMLEKFEPPYDAAVIEMLKKAGAVIVGKTNLDEFAMGSSTERSHFGPTRNPANPNKVSGGSSGGSAAALRAGFVPAALGSDTGGSIRQPSAHCGVAGLKPTYGRVSRYGLVALASSLDHVGPMANDVRDIGLLLSVISQPDKRDETCANISFVDNADYYSGDVKGLRIGIAPEYFESGLSSQVRDNIETLIGRLKELGARVIDISLPNVKHASAAYYVICAAEASSNLARYDGVKFGFRAQGVKSLGDMYEETRGQGFGYEVKARILFGTHILSSGNYDTYYLKACRIRTLVNQDFKNAFNSCDLIISPIAPAAAFDIGEKLDKPVEAYLTDTCKRFTVSANLAGIPAISVPYGTCDGLPLGIQFMAPQWREETLLRVGYAVQVLSS
ncbi:MAG: Asp-tRNA(Asn)/Glu-tRNA(Gln) amidotransferase subunit GatA [Chitinispirillales bacterium]|jgi:aspartyl-tRNA(Asn)/glutamyl-tRNA(Gln) amidotransferase subunit A|nr:Asp-tRNA(Asn)/Glu-tRNA(Gln) amidotransferase subunit GatA [Chitinispirillales bacterium]